MRTLVDGPAILVCDERVDLCNEILDAELGSDARAVEAEAESVVVRVEKALRVARLVLEGRDDAAREPLVRLLEKWEAAPSASER